MNDAPPRTRKPRGQGHERRPEILAAAKQLFLDDGYEGFTTRKLASSVGLSQTGLYVYFHSKEEIFDALCRQSFERLAEALRNVAATDVEGFDRLRAFGRALIDFGLAHPDEYRLSFMDGPGLLKPSGYDPTQGLDAPMDQQGVINQVFSVLRETLHPLAEAGDLRPVNLRLASHTVWFGLHGLISIFIARPKFPKAPLADLIEAELEALVEGLRRR